MTFYLQQSRQIYNQQLVVFSFQNLYEVTLNSYDESSLNLGYFYLKNRDDFTLNNQNKFTPNNRENSRDNIAI